MQGGGKENKKGKESGGGGAGTLRLVGLGKATADVSTVGMHTRALNAPG